MKFDLVICSFCFILGFLQSALRDDSFEPPKSVLSFSYLPAKSSLRFSLLKGGLSRKPRSNILSKNSLTHLALVLILSGDIELNQGHVDKCSLCQNRVTNKQPAIQCNDCELWSHTRCCDITESEYQPLQLTDEKWFCPKCVALCELCSENIFNSDSAVECDECQSWVHTKYLLLPEDQYVSMQHKHCIWICSQCEKQNLVYNIQSSSANFEHKNPWSPLSDTNSKTNFQKHSLSINSINLNAREILELQSYLEINSPDKIQEAKIDNSPSNS